MCELLAKCWRCPIGPIGSSWAFLKPRRCRAEGLPAASREGRACASGGGTAELCAAPKMKEETAQMKPHERTDLSPSCHYFLLVWHGSRTEWWSDPCAGCTCRLPCSPGQARAGDSSPTLMCFQSPSQLQGCRADSPCNPAPAETVASSLAVKSTVSILEN